MNGNQNRPSPWDNLMRELRKNWQLWWRLFIHPRVSLFAKIIPVLSILYWISPFESLASPIFLTPIDDVAAILLGLKLFVELSPQDVVTAIRHEIEYGKPADDEVIDASYRVLDDE